MQLQLYSSTVCMNCLILILFMQHTITKCILNTEIILSIMLTLCLMLLGTYYAQNYAGIIGWCLTRTIFPLSLVASNTSPDEFLLSPSMSLSIYYDVRIWVINIWTKPSVHTTYILDTLPLTTQSSAFHKSCHITAMYVSV